VVDLCCGTGVTTEELLRRVGAHGHVWSVDASPEMLAMARRHIDARNVAFVCWPAESFHIPVEGPADALLCNSAFWQTDAHQTLSSARTVLRDGGLLVFNLPADRVKLDSEQKVDRMFRHSRLQQRMSEIATREYAYTPRSMQSFTPTRPLDADGWKKLLAEHGFELEALELTPNPTSAQSHVEWLKVPVFSTRLLPGLPYALRIEILERAISLTTEFSTLAQSNFSDVR